MTFTQYTYTLRQLQQIAKTMPIAYLKDRQEKADHFVTFDERQEDSLYFYKETTEEYFKRTYGKYAVSELVSLNLEADLRSGRKVPKRISGCCDRADQY